VASADISGAVHALSGLQETIKANIPMKLGGSASGKRKTATGGGGKVWDQLYSMPCYAMLYYTRQWYTSHHTML